jgi:ATP-dependent DNA helicase RecQ
MQQPGEILRQYWGYDTFRPLQKEVIDDLLNGKDVLAILATGGGKSLCYQIPALCLPGCCLVISPLIALMKEQTAGLLKRGIPAAAIYSGMPFKEVIGVLQKGINDHLKLLYVSPERIETDLFKEYLPGLGIQLIAVDEAHCISEWGHDFRPSYRRIVQLREELPTIPLLALTATATPEVQADIQTQLRLSAPSVYKGSLLRPQLSLSVRLEATKEQRLVAILKKVPGTAIVYCRSRKSTESMADFLKEQDISSTAYHGGMASGLRHEHQREWSTGSVRTMVCTNAFGMGIDKADVRLVLHYDLPDTLENYYQEAGRAGRDGAKAYAIALYDAPSIAYLERLPAQRFPDEQTIRDVYRDLVHFLQISSGSGDMEWYPFSLDTFVARFRHRAATTVYALKALEQEELLMYADQLHLAASVTFTISKQALIHFQAENPALDPLIDALLRHYPGILHYPSRISERHLAKLTRLEEPVIVLQLQQLDRSGILSYQAQVNSSQIRLLQPRVRMEDLRIDYRRLLIRKEAYVHKIDRMIHYLTQTTECRSQYINRYFGEQDTPICGICDVCQTR